MKEMRTEIQYLSPKWLQAKTTTANGFFLNVWVGPGCVLDILNQTEAEKSNYDQANIRFL